VAWFPSLARDLVGCPVVSLALGIETRSIRKASLNGTSDIDATCPEQAAQARHTAETQGQMGRAGNQATPPHNRSR